MISDEKYYAGPIPFGELNFGMENDSTGLYEAVYGDMAFMKAQWITHNIAYELATGNPETRRLVSTLAGETAVKVAQRARELDLSPISDMSEKELALTEKIMQLFPAQQAQTEIAAQK